MRLLPQRPPAYKHAAGRLTESNLLAWESPWPGLKPAPPCTAWPTHPRFASHASSGLSVCAAASGLGHPGQAATPRNRGSGAVEPPLAPRTDLQQAVIGDFELHGAFLFGCVCYGVK